MAISKKIDEEAIRQVIKKMFDSYMNVDMGSMLSCYTDDLVVFPQVGDPIYGLEEWQAYVAPRGFEPSDQQIKAADYHLQEIKVAGATREGCEQGLAF